MFEPIEGGAVIDIQGLNCNIPPVGYVYNTITKQLQYIGVYQRSDIPSEQYWERLPFPDWYKEVTHKEDQYLKRKKDDESPFYDERYEEYKREQWVYRLHGFWFMNKGIPVYLTGMNYMYLQFWSIDIGYPKYRVIDLEYFYFLQYCIEDPDCMGMAEICKRRNGKSFRAGLFIVEYITRTKQAFGSVQSKTGSDSKKFFAKTVVSPFRKFPRFFRPEYDMSLGVNPKTEIRFQQTNVRGKKAEDGIDKDELGSMIDWQSADALALDGQKEHRVVNDEFCKTLECNIHDRHEVLRYCILDDEANIIGKLLYTSTVERLETDREGVQEGAKLLWDESDQNNRQENGRTISGLYRFFMTADRSKNFDIYGEPDVEKTIKQILADRAAVKSNPRALAARMRKEPRTIEEAFSSDDDECIFNTININAQKAYLKNNPIKHFRYLHFYREFETQKVAWRDIDPQKTELYWKMLSLPKNGDENKVRLVMGNRYPGRADIGCIGVDGYSNTQGGKQYGSKLSGWMFLKFDLLDPENTGLFMGHIYGRPNEKEDMHNQILLAAEYMGFPVYYEFVADDYYTYFKSRGRLGYLPRFPRNAIDPVKLKKDPEGKDRHRGFPTTEFALTKQNDAMVTYVEHHYDKIYYEELLDDMLKFRPYKRTPSDRTVSAMITLVSSMEVQPTLPKAKEPLVKAYENQKYKENVNRMAASLVGK